jgi:hypothetical protein
MDARGGMRRPFHPQQSAFARVEGRPEARSQAPATQPRSAARAVAAQDPFPNLDHDWDVPAFQRKQR